MSFGTRLRQGPAGWFRRGGAKPRVFVSYRREDAEGHAQWLTDRLSARYHVLFDVDSIAPSDDFVEWIKNAVRDSDAFVAVIGDEWLSVAGPDGRPRLYDPADYLRLELETALQSGVGLVPVLVEGATMPTPGDLPEPLAPLSFKQAIELSRTRRHYDFERLQTALDDVVGGTGGERRWGRIAAAAAAVALVAAAVVGVALLVRDGDDAGGGGDSSAWASGTHPALSGAGLQLVQGATAQGGRLVAVGGSAGDAAVWVSTDVGESWTDARVDEEGGEREVRAVTADGSAFVAVGSASGEAAVWRSDAGGLGWTTVAAPGREDAGSSRLWAVANTGERLVAVGDVRPADFDGTAWYSEDGRRWTRGAGEFGGPDNQVLQGVAHASGTVLAVGHDNGTRNAAVWLSADGGATWERVPDGSLAAEGTEQMRDVIATDEGWLAVGWAAPPGAEPDAAMWRSRDGTRWERAGLEEPGPQDAFAVTADGEGFLAVGSDRGAPAAWTSPDGETWTPVDTAELAGAGEIRAVVRDGGRVVALGRRGGDAGVWYRG